MHSVCAVRFASLSSRSLGHQGGAAIDVNLGKCGRLKVPGHSGGAAPEATSADGEEEDPNAHEEFETSESSADDTHEIPGVNTGIGGGKRNRGPGASEQRPPRQQVLCDTGRG